jgi:NADH:ubiquinone oxidoreductase subunit 5 (subunit L)/multisubunit Na+/H+ antiporter MnhA subunit
VLLSEIVRTRSHADSVVPLRIFFAFWLIAALAVAFYFLRHRERFFSGKEGDRSTDSPAAGNLRMWMVILILLHVAVILTLMIIEI